MTSRFFQFIILFPTLFFFSSLNLQAQQKEPTEPIRCAMDEWLEIQMQDPDFAEKFRQTENRIKAKNIGRSPSCSSPIILPVAIHWNGDVNDVPCLLDMAENQIEVLNRDFGGYNDDLYNYCDHAFACPDEYPLEAVTGGTCVQFCLATQNHPAGSGLQDGDPAFTFGQYTFNTGASQWNGYVNIFVSNVPPNGYGSSLLGLAPLYGGANPNGNGVFVHARCFGGFEEECDAGYIINNSNSYDEGRTTTHELGHYYGLYHTFQGCGSGDGISDTPSQNEPNYGHPTIDYSTCTSTANNTCGTQDFWFNYMDYTNDGGMYMFTSVQSDRIYDVATDGNYKSDALVCGSTNISYDPLYPTGCYVCPTLSVDANSETTLCFGDCNGSISVEDVVDGVGPFTYEWSNGENTPTIDNLCAGDYTVTIHDAFNCEVIETFTVEEPDLLEANSSSTNETGNDFNDGTASANPSGGTEPYYYVWSNNETTQTITALGPGTYIVTVQDYNGCSSIETVEIEEFICPDMAILHTSESILCNGECNGFIQITNVINGEAPLQFAWNSGQTTSLITDLCAGEYVVTVTDAVNCPIESGAIEVVEPEELLISCIATDETGQDTNDGTATVTPSGGVDPYTFAWSNGETTQTITDLPPGTYTVTVTDVNGCSKEDWVIVEEYNCVPMTTQSLTETSTCYSSCDGLIEITDVFNGNPPYYYDWSNGDIDAIVDDLCPGEYDVTITDNNGCFIVETFEITAPDEIVALLSSTDETAYQANDGTAAISSGSGGTPPYEYIWSTGSTDQEISGLAPGDYNVSISDALACTTVYNFSIAAFICPDLSIVIEQSNINCFGECTGSISVSDLNNGTPPFYYEWSNGSNESAITELCAGNYSLTMTDDFNCPVEASYEISQQAEMVIAVESTPETANDANDGTATAVAEGGAAPYSYAWSTGGDTESLENLAPGSYTVTITDDLGCFKTQDFSISEFVCPSDMVVEADQNNVDCYGDCSGTLSVTGLVNGTEPFSYLWYDGSNASSVSDLCAGTYTLTVTDALNCPVETSYEITQPAEIAINLSSTAETGENANDGTASASVSGGTPPYNYLWSNGADTETIVDLAPGNYSLTITDALGCEVENSILVVEFACSNLSLQSEITNNPCFGDCLGRIQVISVNNGTEPYTYQWNEGSNSSTLENLCAGDYQVTITDSNNCTIVQHFTVDQPEEIIITVDLVIDVNASNLGAIDISTNGNYNYEWTGENGFVSEDEDLRNLTKGCYSLVVTDPETNCTADTVICVDDLTAVYNTWQKEIRIYPNPVDQNLSIDFGSLANEEIKLELINWSGNELLTLNKTSTQEKLRINTSKIPAGVYLVKIQQGKTYINRKVVIIH